MKKLSLPLFITAIASAPSFSQEIEEAYVYGELRSTLLNELSNSVSVIDNTAISDREALHIEDLFSIAPNVNFSSGASRGRFIQIRGIGERSQFTAPINPSVGVLVDGIDFTGTPIGATLLDTKQVEVFRGPQGTLFGANALAGMINVVGKEVENEFGVEGKFGAGNFDSRHATLAVNTPFNEDAGWRIAVNKNVSDGFIDNAFLNRDDTNDIDETSLRNLLSWEFGDHSLKLISYFIDIDNGYDAFSLDNNRTTYSDQPGHDRQETFANSLQYQLENDAIIFKAQLSHANNDVEYGYDEDWAFREICAIDSDCAFWQYSTTDNYQRENDNTSLDLRLSSASDSDITWTVGTYIFEQDVDLLRTYTNNDPDGGSFYGPITNPSVDLYSSDYEVDRYAVYGQINIGLSDTLALVAGLRYEDFSSEFIDSNEQSFSPDEDFVGGKLALEWNQGNHFVYGLISRGYKAGGFNPDPDVANENRLFDSEAMWNIEIGDKFQSNDGAVQFQIAAFYQDRDDVQTKQSIAVEEDGAFTFIDFIDNASEGVNYGIEFSFNWLANDAFSFDGSLGLLETEYRDYINLSHVDRKEETGDGVDLDGREQAHAPGYQYYLAANWQMSSRLALRTEVEGKDAFFFSTNHDERSEAYHLLNLRLSYTLENWELSAWGRNLTDETAESRGFYFSNDFGNDPRKFYAPEPYTQKGAPRTFGVTARFSL